MTVKNLGADCPEPTESSVGLESAPDLSEVDASTDTQDNSAEPAEQTDAATQSGRKVAVIPESLHALQVALVDQEAATDAARRARNIEVARLRDTQKVSQYRISKWLGVTERAVMLMAKQGREHLEQD